MDSYVAAHTRQVVLAALKLLRDSSVRSDEIGRMPASAILSRLGEPTIVRLSAAALHDPALGRLESLATSLLRDDAEEVPEVITSATLAPGLLTTAETSLAQELDVREAWQAALSVLDSAMPSVACLVRTSVLLLTGVNGPRGQIIGFTHPRWPATVSFGVNNPPVLLAEEVLHETTHVRLWARLAVDSDLDVTLARLPAVYSPFTGTLRPAVRVVHGIVSYAAVLRLWLALASREPQPNHAAAAFADPVKIQSRVETLRQRIAGAVLQVCRVWPSGSLDDLLIWAAGCSASDLGLPRNIVRSTVLPPLRLSNIESAEYILAAAGRKVSRLCLSLEDASTLARTAACTAIASDEAIDAVPHPCLGGFSHVVRRTLPLVEADPDSEVFVYLAARPEDAVEAFRLDAENGAGSLFQIPQCCREYFAAAWPASRSAQDGDLFAQIILDLPGGRATALHWTCNAAAMYFGGGLCWHFPCGPACDQTCSIVENRFKDLHDIDPILALRLRDAMFAPLLWCPELGYASLPSGASGDTPLACARWLVAAPEEVATLTVDRWLSQSDRRRFLLPTSRI